MNNLYKVLMRRMKVMKEKRRKKKRKMKNK